MARKTTPKSKAKRDNRKARKLRFSPDEESRIQMRADLYAGGNFSKWVRHAALECPGKMLVE